MSRRRRGPFGTAIKLVEFCVRNLSIPLAIAFAATKMQNGAGEIRQGLVGLMTAEGAGKDLLEKAGKEMGRGLREGKPFFNFLKVF
jgi:hypothetical protein